MCKYRELLKLLLVSATFMLLFCLINPQLNIPTTFVPMKISQLRNDANTNGQ